METEEFEMPPLTNGATYGPHLFSLLTNPAGGPPDWTGCWVLADVRILDKISKIEAAPIALDSRLPFTADGTGIQVLLNEAGKFSFYYCLGPSATSRKDLYQKRLVSDLEIHYPDSPTVHVPWRLIIPAIGEATRA